MPALRHLRLVLESGVHRVRDVSRPEGMLPPRPVWCRVTWHTQTCVTAHGGCVPSNYTVRVLGRVAHVAL